MSFMVLNNVSKRYALGHTIVASLDGISLSIARGDFVAVVGPSGSGKSTLLHILGTLDTPTEGTYRLDGHDVAGFSEKKLAQLRNGYIGFVFQDFSLLPELTAMQNIELPMIYAKISAKERKERALHLLDQVNLTDRKDHFPNQLSGGQQQRIAIARALANNPIVILADEPTGNVSQEAGQEIMGILQHLNDLGVTVIVVTHDLHIASQCKQRVSLLDGKITENTAFLSKTVLDGENQ